jgi:hypothetical protein
MAERSIERIMMIKAEKGGFLVCEEPDSSAFLRRMLFAGSLLECLEFIRKQFEPEAV